MKKHNAAALLMAAVFSVSAAAGCSSAKKKSNEFTAETIRAKGGDTQYNTENFSFSLSSELTKSDMEGFDLVFTATTFPIMIGINESLAMNMNADANAVEFLNTCVDEGTEATWDHFDNKYMDCAAVHTSEYAADENDPNNMQCYHIDTYNAVNEISLLNISMSYPDGLQEISRTYAEYILSAAEYTGDVILPKEAETTENEYVSVYHEPEWYAAQNEDTDLSSSEFQVINFMYAHTDSADKVKTKYSLKAVKKRDLNTANKMAHSALEKAQDDMLRENAAQSSGELFGEKAYMVTYNTKDAVPYNGTEYYFEKGNIIWVVTTVIPSNDDGTIAADIQKLMDNTTFK